MDAAFETRVLEDGVWVTRTVGIDVALQATSAVDEPEDVSEPPHCGLLSTTVLESPQVHKILPVRLRSQAHNDIAFIGDHSITIRELLDNGQTHGVLSRMSLGQRIRNAVVIGETLHESRNYNNLGDLDGISASEHSSSPHRPPFPPQMLLCMLESGELISLYLMNGEAVISRVFEPSRAIPYLGYYLAVEPQSRYIAAAGFEDVMIIHELEPWSILKHNYEMTGSVGSVIKSTKYLPIRATLFDVHFLYPRSQDHSHVILMALTSSRSRDGSPNVKQRYFVWDWVAGEDLSERLKSGQRQQLIVDGTPLFCIPLRAQYAFFVVSERGIAIIKQTLTGAGASPEYMRFGANVSTVHHGKDEPLWTAWARPFRREEWFQNNDIIYLAREDGKIQSIEIDGETLLTSINEADDDKNDGLGVNIGPAFATTYDKSADIIIVGGNSGPGGIWRIEPRSSPKKMSIIDDWSPVVDMTTTSDDLSWEAAARVAESDRKLSRGITKRDRVFLASGRGKTGCVVEPRYGIKARIGLEMDLGDPAKDVWLFPDSQLQDGSMNVVLALPHSTQVIHLSATFEDIVAESPDTTPFDLSSRTIHASCASPGYVVQVSESSVTLITPLQRSRHSFEDILRSPGILVEQASRRDQFVVVCTSSADGARLHTLRIEEMAVVLICTHEISEEVTCLAIAQIGDRQFVAVGTLDSEGPLLCLYSLTETQGLSQVMRQRIWTGSDSVEPLEALLSISMIKEDEDVAYLAAGTRCGHILTISIKPETSSVTWTTERLGLGPVGVFPSQISNQEDDAVAFATCDSALVRLTKLTRIDRPKYQSKEIILPVNVEEPSLGTLSIHALFATQTNASARPLLLLLGASHLYFAELDRTQGPVPRTLPLGRSPTRIIYSNLWQCLVVALALPDGSGVELEFIDPDQSLDPHTQRWPSLSKPLDAKEEEGRLTAFDTSGDRVLVLREWVYLKGGRTFSFIIVGLKSAKLVVVSVNQNKQAEPVPLRRHLTHSSRWRLKGLEGPVTAVVTDEKGFLCCSGRTLRRYVLEDRKLVSVKEFELDSPAVSLEIHGGAVYALTTGHSLEVVDYQSNESCKEMTLLHSDSVTRSGMHMIQVGPVVDKSRWPVSLVGDSHHGVAGIWTPKGQKHRELSVVFDGALSNPVRKFARARCRSAHQGGEADSRFEGLPSTADNAEILGVSLNGKLRSFRLLDPDLWAVLNEVQSLTLGYSSAASLWRRPKSDNMHIDGDILAWCLQRRLLEHMIQEEHDNALLNALERLDGGMYVARMRSQSGTWNLRQACELCYTIIEPLVRPVI